MLQDGDKFRLETWRSSTPINVSEESLSNASIFIDSDKGGTEYELLF